MLALVPIERANLSVDSSSRIEAMLRAPSFEFNRSQRGMVAVQVALCMTAVLGVVALLVDGGLVFTERRHAQATADAAALAAASDLYANWNSNGGTDPNGTAKTSALNVASTNGYANNGKTSKVRINISPADYSGGPNAGKALPAGYAEVTVTWYQTRGLSSIWGTATIPISARAVARGVSAPGSSTSGLPGILFRPVRDRPDGRGKWYRRCHGPQKLHG
jgi:uncharacterized membrane protein